MWVEVIGSNDVLIAHRCASQDPPASGTGTLYDDDPFFLGRQERLLLCRRDETRGDAGHDDGPCAGLHKGPYGGPVRTGVSGRDIDPWQGLQSAHMELRVRGVTARLDIKGGEKMEIHHSADRPVDARTAYKVLAAFMREEWDDNFEVVGGTINLDLIAVLEPGPALKAIVAAGLESKMVQTENIKVGEWARFALWRLAIAFANPGPR